MWLCGARCRANSLCLQPVAATDWKSRFCFSPTAECYGVLTQYRYRCSGQARTVPGRNRVPRNAVRDAKVPGSSYFCTRTVYFCTLKVYFCTLKVYFGSRKVYLCIRKVYFCTLKVYFCTRKVYVCTRKEYFCTRKVYFCTLNFETYTFVL